MLIRICLFKVTFSIDPLFLFAFRGTKRKSSKKKNADAPAGAGKGRRATFEKVAQNFSGRGTVRT